MICSEHFASQLITPPQQIFCTAVAWSAPVSFHPVSRKVAIFTLVCSFSFHKFSKYIYIDIYKKSVAWLIVI